MENFGSIKILPNDIIFEKPERIRRPFSWVEHIPFAFKLIEVLSPNIIVELGTHSGNSFCAFNQAIKMLNLPSKCFAIDTWEGDKHSGQYDSSVFNDLFEYCKVHYSQTAILIKKSFDEAVEDFQNDSIDLLHIDGLHTYEAVSNDFYNWLPKLSTKAVVLFHDIEVNEGDFGVYRFWKEINVKYPSFEFLFGNGMGILFVGDNISKYVMDELLDYQSNEMAVKVFSIQGKLLHLRSENVDLNHEIERLREYNSSLFFTLEKYRNSTSFYIGALILKPISFFIRLFIRKTA